MTMSAASRRARSCSMPARSREVQRHGPWPACSRSKNAGGPRRAPSGRPVLSTLTTVPAPASVSTCPHSGPAHSDDRSTTRASASDRRGGPAPAGRRERRRRRRRPRRVAAHGMPSSIAAATTSSAARPATPARPGRCRRARPGAARRRRAGPATRRSTPRRRRAPARSRRRSCGVPAATAGDGGPLTEQRRRVELDAAAERGGGVGELRPHGAQERQQSTRREAAARPSAGPVRAIAPDAAQRSSSPSSGAAPNNRSWRSMRPPIDE